MARLRRTPIAHALLSGLATLGACDGHGQWILLRERDGIRSPSVAGPASVAGEGRSHTRIIAPGAWELGHAAGIWSAELEYCTAFDPWEDAALLAGEQRYARLPATDAVTKLVKVAPGTFTIHRNKLVLRLAPGERPGELTLSFPGGSSATNARGRPAVGGFAGDGFALEPPETIGFPLDLPPRSALRFFLARVGMETGARLGLEVRLDGAPLFSVEVPGGPSESGEWYVVPLPRGGRREATLEFALAGGSVRAAVLAPAIGALEPKPASRPDILLFLADTFRADNLEACGGDPARAPSLDALARRSVVFPDARSTSTWTLPAQASMLTGLYPEQHGAVNKDRIVAGELLTLAEHLAQHGYRTGAVTDSAYVSREFGLDQGFEWFHESRSWDLRATLASALDFLRHADGRPVFLFVHTYRTHAPYRTGAGELCHGPLPDDETAMRELRRRYLEGVRALDDQLGT